MGKPSEYSENVPSDLEFLGGEFSVLPTESLRENDGNDGPGLRLIKEVVLKMLEFSGWSFSVEPFDEYTRMRGKHKGKWREILRFPAALHEDFTIEVSRLWCGNPEPHLSLPFDGLLLLAFPDGKWHDLWVSAVRGIHGFIFQFSFTTREKSFDLDLDKLGFAADDLRSLKQAVDAPKGMVLLTGLTHSGKSIVCYSSVMRRLRRGDSVTTIERPRKFRLPGARQIHLKKYVDYLSELPNALEDDPRVLLVQDICYFQEFEASLTIARDRLLVAATHMSEVLFCLQRLYELGGGARIPNTDLDLMRRYRALLAENLSLVCSGRQVRLLCPSCKTAVEMPVALLVRNGLRLERKGSVLTFASGKGCGECQGSGVMKRTGIYEVLPISPAMRRLLSMEVPPCALFRQAREDGLVSLRETAMKMVLDGTLSFQEAISATPAPYHQVR